MRLLLPLLLLSTAAPVLAADPEVEREGAMEQVFRAGADERPSRAERPQRVERAERPQRVERAERPQAMPEQFERIERAERVERPRRAAREVERVERLEAPAPVMAEPVTRVERPDGSSEIRRERSGDSVRDWRWQERRESRQRRAGGVPPPAQSPVLGESLPSPATSAPPVGAQAEQRTGSLLRNRIATEGWRREWRQDRRFDWRRHRDRDRNRFRVGIYIDPFGWRYRRWNVGWGLYPHYYSTRYWINDPWQYRLPPVYGPYRWVRYWDDAILVDLRTGRVVDVIHNFFW
jgi:Ni/Co efflux regulator RcnB